jgi:hypothetical protein
MNYQNYTQTHIVNDLFAQFIFLAYIFQHVIKKSCFHFRIEKITISQQS